MNYKGQIEEKTYISFELAENGSLYNYIINQDILTDEVARLLFQQLINGIEYIHGEGYAHRDLKPSNLLFGDNFVLKIADFGLSEMCKDKL